MAARDKYSYVVTCTKCASTALFNVSEDDYPFMRGPNRKIDGIVGDMTGRVEKGVIVWARCGTCKTEFKP
jgi:hypothetical protein